MSTTNRQPDRSLDRRGGPDERARPPRELLDNLRLRLSQLAENHPSAPGYPHRGRSSGDGQVSGDDRTGGAGTAAPDGQAMAGDADAAAGHEGESAAGGSGFAGVFGDMNRTTGTGSDIEAGSQAGRGAGGWAGEAARSAAAAMGLGIGVLATMELPVRGRSGDPYRPWFMAGEPGSPWWTGTLY
jgi:hypothetical protein